MDEEKEGFSFLFMGVYGRDCVVFALSPKTYRSIFFRLSKGPDSLSLMEEHELSLLFLFLTDSCGRYAGLSKMLSTVLMTVEFF